MQNTNEKIREACSAVLAVFQKLNDPKHEDIISKLEFVIGSFDFDKNPIGLIEFGKISLDMLKKIKEKSPRKVPAKLIKDLEKYLH